MKVERPDPAYFELIDEDPVTLYPFDQVLLDQSNEYLTEINAIIESCGVAAVAHGSLPLGLGGKNEWEYAIYLDIKKWASVRAYLVEKFGEQNYEETEMILFKWKLEDGRKVELVLMCGDMAIKNKAITEYWKNNKKAREEYEALKYEHTHSKRAYYWWKANYIADILERL
jgi:hypothetical protein